MGDGRKPKLRGASHSKRFANRLRSLRLSSGFSILAAMFDREQMRERVAALAGQGVFIGTSSWKYPGWCGTLYDPQRYEWRGKFVESRFNRNCVREYAEVFKTVCVDAAYYSFPTRTYLESMAHQVPDDFQFAFKVT